MLKMTNDLFGILFYSRFKMSEGETLPLRHPVCTARDVYITRKLPLVVYFKRVKKLLTEFLAEPNEECVVTIYGAGCCIKGAMMLLQDALATYPHLIGSYRYSLSTQKSHRLIEASDDPLKVRYSHVMTSSGHFLLPSARWAESSCFHIFDCSPVTYQQ